VVLPIGQLTNKKNLKPSKSKKPSPGFARVLGFGLEWGLLATVLAEQNRSRWTLIVLRESWVFVSSLDSFVALLFCSLSMVGEDMFCSSREAIEADYAERLAASGVPASSAAPRLAAASGGDSDDDGAPAVLCFKDVLPAGQIPRIDANEWNYKVQHAARGEAEPAVGRPVWDLHQNVLKDTREDPYVPTVLPASTLYSSGLARPATSEEHMLCQGLVIVDRSSRPVAPSQPRPSS